MLVTLAFAVTLVVALLLSELARRSVLSMAVVFLGAGILLGATGILNVRPTEPSVSTLVEVTLYAVLFTDAMQVGWRDLLEVWRLPGRALLFGMPLTVIGMAVLARYLVGLSWAESFLIGSVLAPTDPVLANAILGHESVPLRLRRLLGVESGLNDGIALPAVLGFLAIAGGHEGSQGGTVAIEIAIGIALGVAIPWAVVWLSRQRAFAIASRYQPLLGFGVGLLVFATTRTLHGNLFLAAFAAGTTTATVGPEVRSTFSEFGESVTELLKLLALLLFGMLISPSELSRLPLGTYAFAVLVLLAVRPAAIEISLAGSDLDWRERVAAAWFGPRGFASVVYGLFVLQSGITNGVLVFHTVALVVGLSIVAHSSTDVPVARWFRRAMQRARQEEPHGVDEPPTGGPQVPADADTGDVGTADDPVPPDAR